MLACEQEYFASVHVLPPVAWTPIVPVSEPLGLYTYVPGPGIFAGRRLSCQRRIWY
jgi:hypothetical protein